MWDLLEDADIFLSSLLLQTGQCAEESHGCSSSIPQFGMKEGEAATADAEVTPVAHQACLFSFKYSFN